MTSWWSVSMPKNLRDMLTTHLFHVDQQEQLSIVSTWSAHKGKVGTVQSGLAAGQCLLLHAVQHTQVEADLFNQPSILVVFHALSCSMQN